MTWERGFNQDVISRFHRPAVRELADEVSAMSDDISYYGLLFATTKDRTNGQLLLVYQRKE